MSTCHVLDGVEDRVAQVPAHTYTHIRHTTLFLLSLSWKFSLADVSGELSFIL